MGTIRAFGDVEVIAGRLALSLEQARAMIGRFAQIGITPARLLALLDKPANARTDAVAKGQSLAQLADYIGFVIRLPGASPDRLREGFEELMAHPAVDLSRLGYLMLYFSVLVQQPGIAAATLLNDFIAAPHERAASQVRAGVHRAKVSLYR